MKPALTPRAQADLAARLEREAEALRANLKRRKAQQRAKEEISATEPVGAEREA